MTPHNEPLFPVADVILNHSITKREWMAAMFLHGFIAVMPNRNKTLNIDEAVKYADLLLERLREKDES